MKTFLLTILTFSQFLLSQKKDSINIPERPRFEAKQLIIPATLMATGAVVLTTENRNATIIQNKNYLAFGGFFEDYAQFLPHISVYTFELAGMKPKTDFWNRSAILAKSQIIVMGSSYILKETFREPRPDGSNKFGFPSGHTATAFSGAEMLSMEYKEDYPWVPYAAYTVASGVGVLRVVHDKHYWSDVIFGAGLGILSTKLAYWTHQYKWNKKEKSQKDPFQNVIYKN